MKEVIQLLMRTVSAASLSYIVTLILIKKLTVADFGSYSYILLVSSLISIFVNFGVDQTTARESKNYKNQRMFFISCNLFKVINLCLSVLFFTLFSGLEQGILVLFASVQTLYTSNFFELKNKNVIFLNFFLAERTLYLIVCVLLFFTEQLNIYYVFASLFLISFLSLCLQYIHIFMLFPGNFEFKELKVFHLYKNNLWVVFSTLILFGYGGLSRFFIEDKFGLTDLGAYSAFWQFVMIATLIQGQIDKIWRPRIYVSSLDGKFFENFKNYSLYVVLPVACISASLILLMEFIVLNVFKIEYTKYIYLGYIFCTYFIVVCYDSYFRTVYISMSKEFLYFLINLFFSFLLTLFFLFTTLSLSTYAVLLVVAHASSVFILSIFGVINVCSQKR